MSTRYCFVIHFALMTLASLCHPALVRAQEGIGDTFARSPRSNATGQTDRGTEEGILDKEWLAQRRGATRPVPRRQPPRYLFRVFGQAGIGRFAADQTFTAVMGRATAPWIGGGIQVRTSGGVFIEAAVERYQDTGNRVFVFDGEVFDLGSDTTVRIVPVTVSGGYRFWQRRTTALYASGGIGRAFYRETTAGASSDENVTDRFATYQGTFGAETALGPRWAAAFEFQYSTTPDALGAGVASLYDERDLGVMQVRVKVLFGR